MKGGAHKLRFYSKFLNCNGGTEPKTTEGVKNPKEEN